MAAVAIIAVQAMFDRACFLTVWQEFLAQNAGQSGSQAPLVQRWVSEVIFWSLPIWFFALPYVAVWIYAMVLWRLVPPRRRGKAAP